MSKAKKSANIPASVRQRLLNLSLRSQVIGELRTFLWPVLVAATEKETFAQGWDNGGPWKEMPDKL